MADPRVSPDATNAAFEGLKRRQAPENGTPAIDVYEPYGPPAPYTPGSYVYRPEQRGPLTPGELNSADFEANIDAWQRDIYPSQFGPNQQWKPNNDTVGPDGSKLPRGAKGWDWAGRAYYGDGLDGAFKEWAYKVVHGTGTYEGDVIATKQGNTFLAGGMNVDPNKVKAAAGETLDVWETIANFDKKWVMGNDSPVGVSARLIQESVGAIVTGFGAASKGTKRLTGIGEGLADAGEGSFLPDIRDAKWSDWFNQALVAQAQRRAEMRGTESRLANPEDAPGWDDLVNRFGSITPPMLLYNGLRTLTSPQDWDEKVRDINENYQSAQIMYTTFLQPAVEEEYIRRLRAGENPILLARELENPWVEMVGEMIFDPLNFLGAGPAKAAKQGGRITRAFEEFLNVNPEIKTALSAWGKATATGADLDNLVAAQQKVTQAVAKGFDEFAADGRMIAFTPQAKAYQMGRRVGTVLQTVAANAGSKEEALEYMRLLMQMHGSPDEIATAYAGLRNFRLTGKAAMAAGEDVAPKLLLSRAGQETGLMLRRVLEDENGVVNVKKFLGELAKQKTTTEMVEFATKRIGAASADMMPDIGRRFEILNKAKTGGKLTPLQARIAAMGELSPGQMAYWKLTKKIDPGYKFVNSMLAGVYMGLSPGFAFRNLLTNSFHVLIDEGPGALFTRPVDALKGTSDYLGYTPDIGGYGVSTMGANADAFKVAGKGLPFQQLSEKFERWGAVQSYYAGVRKTMESMLVEGKAIPETKALLDAGLAPADAKTLVSLARKYKGDIPRVTREFLEQLRTGEIDALTSFEWLPDVMRKQLSDNGVLDRVQAAITEGRAAGKTMDEVLADIQKISQEFVDEAARVVDDVPTVNPEALGADDINLMVEQGVDETTVKLGTHITEANHQANSAYNTVVSQAFEEASMKVRGDQAATAKLQEWWDKARKWFSMEDGAQFRRMNNQRRETAVLWDKRSFLDDFDVAEAWAQLGLKGPAPTGDNPKDVAVAFRHALWGEYYFPFQIENLKTYREIHVALGERMMSDLNAFVPGLNQNELLKARAQYNMALQWDNVLRDDQVRQQLVVALNRGDNPGAARAYARQFGLDAPTDQHILNTVNKYAPYVVNDNTGEAVKYAHLAEVPPDVAKKAFIRRLADRAGASQFSPPMPIEVKMARAKEIVNGFEKTVATTRTADMPEAMRKAVQNKANDMYIAVESGAPGKRGEIRFDDAPGGIRIDTHSTYPAWYGELGKDKGYVLRVLAEFREGVEPVSRKGTDIYEKIRKIIVDEIFSTHLTEPGKKAGVVVSRSLTNPMDLWDMEMYDNAVTMFNTWMNTEREIDQFVNHPKYGDMFSAWERWQKGGAEAMWADLPEPGIAKVLPEMPGQLGKAPAPVPPYAGEAATPARAITEQSEGIQDMFRKLSGMVQENWNAKRFTYSNADIAKAVENWGKEGAARVGEARAIARKVGEAAKDFTMLSYPEKRNLDLALAYIYPYHFWYNRTYANWMKRLAYNPEIIAAYAKYKDAMAQAHAGSPEWWKYNTAVTSLLGMDLDNPLFFNLEATLNPLNGLTGVDFKDPYKRVNWFTAMLDDMGRLGPSTWTPFNYATALALMMSNEQEAASRWGGRLIPQTATIKAALTAAGVRYNTQQGINEFDPAVNIFSGGLDPYERRRVGRALGAMVDDGTITQAQAVDAAQQQEGEIWRTAIERAIKDRAGGQIASFLFGVGFKARKATDQQIDLMDQEWRMLWAQKSEMTPAELRMRQDELRARYPFMDAVLLSRKSGFERDRSYAYNVIGRIPPGQRDDITKLAGIDPRLFDKFYNDKGAIDKWAKSDYQKFMGAILDIGAMLEMPDAATRQEWTAAQNANDQMYATLETMFGKDIRERMDRYYSYKTSEEKNAYLAANPDVQAAMSYKDASVVENPVLAPYYSSVDVIERYYRGVMYDLVRMELGIKDMTPILDGLREAQLTKTDKQYRRDHPEIDRYYDLLNQYEKWVNDAIIRAAKNLPEPKYPDIRTDNAIDTIGETDVAANLAGGGQFNPYELTWDEVQAQMKPELQRLVLDAVVNGSDLSYYARKQLDYIAQDYGIDADMLLEILRSNIP